MFERLLDKDKQPDLSLIREYIGEEGFARLCRFEEILGEQYVLSKEIRFPFGNSYGWGYKYSHRSFHLCYAFFERGAFTVMVQIGDRQVPSAEIIIASLSSKARELWAARYPCGDCGGWVKYRVTEDEDLKDVVSFVNAKKPLPKR